MSLFSVYSQQFLIIIVGVASLKENRHHYPPVDLVYIADNFDRLLTE
jgi:hypothetical protein